MSPKMLISQLWMICLLVLYCQNVSSQLQVGFYGNSCNLAEFVIKNAVRYAFIRDRGIAAGLVRMHFHDCFVRGCDGSVLINSTATNKAEKDSPINNPSLRGFEVIDDAKARLEAIPQCKGIVSCADILAFAARDSIEITGGFGYDVPAGRRDGRVSLASETLTNLPPPTSNVAQLTQSFANKGFTQDEMVTLSGAHTIGRAHCSSFSSRLYSFNVTNAQDPKLDASYAASLKQLCPQGSPNLVVPMNPSSPANTDVGYYIDVLANRGLLTSDQTLLTNAQTAGQVKMNANNPMTWKQNFAAAMVKMGQIGVLTGNAGEIRAKCRGCDGSVLIDSTPSNTAEKDSPVNNPSLEGFEVIDNAKAKLEAECAGSVSCADILALAARDSIEITGGPCYDVPAGRRDGRISRASEVLANLPAPNFNLDQLTQSFESKGLSQEEMDPSLDARYAARLKQLCPPGSSNSDVEVPMDPGSPTTVDVGYYCDVLENRGLFTSDHSLLTSISTANQVREYARNPLLWRKEFADAMVKMGQIGVLTGNDGEVRANCRVINN
ncbi:hypothetical protein Tsubulata_015323, partial [Turnera subulata]